MRASRWRAHHCSSRPVGGRSGPSWQSPLPPGGPGRPGPRLSGRAHREARPVTVTGPVTCRWPLTARAAATSASGASSSWPRPSARPRRREAVVGLEAGAREEGLGPRPPLGGTPQRRPARRPRPLARLVATSTPPWPGRGPPVAGTTPASPPEGDGPGSRAKVVKLVGPRRLGATSARTFSKAAGSRCDRSLASTGRPRRSCTWRNLQSVTFRTRMEGSKIGTSA